MIKVTFHATDDSKRSFTCKMRSFKVVEDFISDWKYFGGYNRFEADIHGETKERIPELSETIFTFQKIIEALYSNSQK